MATRKINTTVFLESSALIPMLDSGNAIQARILAHLKTMNAHVGIDTVVLSEYLAGLDESTDKAEVVERLSKQFRVYSFDAHTAIVCAEVFRILKAKGQIPKAKSERQITKADIMIMASAIVSGSAEFIYNDGHFSSYPKFLPTVIHGHGIPVFVRAKDLPPVIVQDDLGI